MINITPKTVYYSWDDQIHFRRANTFLSSETATVPSTMTTVINKNTRQSGYFQTQEEQQAYYDTLNKLGLSKRKILKTVRKQLLIYFLFPVTLPFIINFFITVSLNHVFAPFLATNNAYLTFILLSSSLFLIIYLIYYLIAYFSFKRCLEY